jgi:hypothetical protein
MMNQAIPAAPAVYISRMRTGQACRQNAHH